MSTSTSIHGGMSYRQRCTFTDLARRFASLCPRIIPLFPDVISCNGRLIVSVINRIAHHDPIHKLNISVQHTTIIETIGWLCSDTKDWVKHHSTVNSILRTSPSAKGEDKPHFSERADNDFVLVPVGANLSTLPSNRLIICLDTYKESVSIIEKQHLYAFLASKVDENNESLLVTLSDYCLSHVISHNSIKNNFSNCSSDESFYKAITIFKDKGINYIIVRKPDEFSGVIAKAHRRY